MNRQSIPPLSLQTQSPSSNAAPARPSVLFSRRGLAAWAALAIGLLLTGFISMRQLQDRNQSADTLFQLRATDLINTIERRLRDHEQILLGGAGLFDASGDVSRQEWRAYVARLRLNQNYPGIQGVGFSQVIAPAELERHLAAVRNQGFPDYTVRPPGERALYTSIIYLEPFAGRNLAAFGFDMFSEATRRKAMEQAVEGGMTSISGKVKLVQETHGREQAGFLMYVPVYYPYHPLTTPAERWKALRGFVYSPYRVDDLMAGIRGEGNKLVDLTIHDGISTDAASLLYDSSGGKPQAPASRHQLPHVIRAYGHSWTVTVTSRPNFEAQFEDPMYWLVLVLGSGFSLSLFALLATLLGQHGRALSLAADMSARRAESEERFHQLFLHLGQGVVIHDAEGRISDANPAAEHILGLSLEQLQGISSTDPRWRTIREDGSRFPGEQHPVQQALLSGNPVTGTLMGIWHPQEKDWRWIRVDAYPRHEGGHQMTTRVYAVFSDITRERAAERARQEQARLTQTILDTMIDGIITINADGIIQSANPSARRIFGYTELELLDHNVKMLMPNPYRDAHDQYLRSFQLTGQARIIGIGRDVEGLRRDGSLFPLELSVAEIRHGSTPLYVGMVRDITERKRVERMKSEFVSTVSHELRTPLTAISGALGLISGGAMGVLPDRARDLVAIAHKNSLQLSRLINDLLDMDKLAAGKMQLSLTPHRLPMLVQDALDANRACGSERQVSLQLQGELPAVQVNVDSQRLMQILSNLLSNAIKFSPTGGRVDVSAILQGNRVQISVTDRGPGIPAAFRDHIFQKFAQADSSDTRQRGGTGLGLAISRELAQSMGGQLGYQSEEGHGACFFLELPVIHDETGSASPSTATPSARTNNTSP